MVDGVTEPLGEAGVGRRRPQQSLADVVDALRLGERLDLGAHRRVGDG